MFRESDQGFSSFDALALIGSVLVLVAVIVPILDRRIEMAQVETARILAQEIAFKIPTNEKLSPHKLKDPQRAPSSQEGAASPEPANQTTDLDPWGQPYRYTYLSSTFGQPLYLAVWSVGSNGEAETQVTDLTVDAEGVIHARFLGDDVGFLRALR